LIIYVGQRPECVRVRLPLELHTDLDR